MSINPIIPDDAFRSAMPNDAIALRSYLETLKVGPIRELAAKGMPMRHESKKAEMIEWLVRNIPAEIRQHRAKASEAGKFAIKVVGEEIDHADTRSEARRHRDTIIYGGIGTEANTSIEPKG